MMSDPAYPLGIILSRLLFSLIKVNTYGLMKKDRRISHAKVLARRI